MFKANLSRKEVVARVVSPVLFIALVGLGAASYTQKNNQTLGAIAIIGAVLLAGLMARTATTNVLSAAHFALFSGLALSAVSLIGLGMWLEADWFADPGPYSQNLWSGYDSRHFIGLVMLTIAAPAGVTLSVVGLHMLARSRSPRRARFYNAVRFGYGLTCAGLGGAGTWWGWIMGRCLGAFCLNPDVWTPAPVGARPTAGYGWMATVGITAFFSLLPIGCIMCVASARSLTARWHARVADMDAPTGAVRAPFRLHRTALDINVPLRPTRRHLVWFLVRSSVTFLVLLAFAIVSMYMPNSWEYFAADRIAQQAQWQLSLNYTQCGLQNAEGNYPYTCSDYPWAYFGAWNIVLNAGWWIIRLFPSSVFWFTYMLLLLAGATLLTAAGRRSDRLTRQRKLSFGPVRMRVSLAQLMGGGLTLGMLSLFAVYWFHDHNFDTLGGPNDTGIAHSERYGRAFGQMAVALMGLLIFPASRSSIVHTTLGTSWEGLIWVHRILGYGMLGCTVAHVIAWWVKFGQIGLFRDIFQVPMTMPTNADNFTVPLITVTTFILLVSMGILALEPVRRRAFELFYYSHLFAVYTTVPAVLWHAAAGWEYLLPGLTVWFADRLLRHVRSSRAATVTEQWLCADDVVTLRFHQADLEVRPGQYVFVHIAELSALEWHPFTVSSVDNERHSFTLHIKAMQPPSADAPPPAYLSWLPAPTTTWTQRLKRAVVNKIPLTLSVDGPCGPLHDFAHFRQILLVAGGIGVTPCAALVERLRANMKLERLQLHWATRDAALARSFSAQLDPIPGDPRYHGVLYVTRAPGDDLALDTLPLRVVAGRPNLDRIMDSMYDPKDPDPSSTLVFVCGTRGMVESCASLAIAKGFTFHEETFFL